MKAKAYAFVGLPGRHSNISDYKMEAEAHGCREHIQSRTEQLAKPLQTKRHMRSLTANMLAI